MRERGTEREIWRGREGWTEAGGREMREGTGEEREGETEPRQPGSTYKLQNLTLFYLDILETEE